MIRRFPRGDNVETAVNTSLIRKVITRINKGYKGSRKLTTLGESVFSSPRNYVPTGVFPLDCIICFGKGFPVGIVEVYGPESSGKTAILEHTLATSQKKGYYTIIFPQEFSLDYKRVKTVGLSDDALIIGDAETVEDVYDQILKIVREIRKKDQDTPIVIGWDTIASTPTRTELVHKEGLASSDMGRAAAQLSKLFRRLVRFLFENNVCLICINQTRTNIAMMYGDKETTYGGKALRFYAWIRLRVTKTKDIEGPEGKKIGFLCKVFSKKNKAAPPLRECMIPVYWSNGIDPIGAIWEYCTENGIFVRKGSAYRYNGFVITKKTFGKFYEKHGKSIRKQMRASVL